MEFSVGYNSRSHWNLLSNTVTLRHTIMAGGTLHTVLRIQKRVCANNTQGGACNSTKIIEFLSG